MMDALKVAYAFDIRARSHSENERSAEVISYDIDEGTICE